MVVAVCSRSRCFLCRRSIYYCLKCVEMNSCWLSDCFGRVVGVGGIATVPRSAPKEEFYPAFL